MSYDMSVEYIP